MKKTFYQWLIRTVLALSCLLTTTSAWADTWTVAGAPASLFGTTWSPSTTANDMTNVGGTKYVFLRKMLLSLRQFRLKFVKIMTGGQPILLLITI